VTVPSSLLRRIVGSKIGGLYIASHSPRVYMYAYRRDSLNSRHRCRVMQCSMSVDFGQAETTIVPTGRTHVAVVSLAARGASTREFNASPALCCVENTCCKYMFQLFQMFQRYIASVLYGYCKVHPDVAHVAMTTYVCCKSLFKMFICFRRLLKVFYLNVAYVIMVVLQVYVPNVLSVSYVYYNSLSSECCKSISGCWYEESSDPRWSCCCPSSDTKKAGCYDTLVWRRWRPRMREQ
jgi:hypothetical protein